MDDTRSQAKYPCVFEPFGCDQQFELNNKIAHEEVCGFRPNFCPYRAPICTWQGEAHEVLDHLREAHSEVAVDEYNEATFLAAEMDTPTASDWAMILNCFNHYFVLTLVKHDEDEDKKADWVVVVQLIGSRTEAEQFVYRVTLNGPDRRRLIWEATPHPTSEAVGVAIRETSCLIFDSGIAKLFSEEGELMVNIIISKVDD